MVIDVRVSVPTEEIACGEQSGVDWNLKKGLAEVANAVAVDGAGILVAGSLITGTVLT